MSEKLKGVIIAVSVLVLLIIAVPFFVARVMRSAAQPPSEGGAMEQPLYVKVQGTLENKEGVLVLRGDNGKNYMLSGERELKSLMREKVGENVYVFGAVRTTGLEVDGESARFLIRVVDFGHSLSDEQIKESLSKEQSYHREESEPVLE